MALDVLSLRILHILQVPLYNQDVLWTVAPLIFALVMFQMYFGYYKTEQLGWNTAFGNSISLMWVSFALIRYFQNSFGLLNIFKMPQQFGYVILILVMIGFTFVLAFANFRHILPKKIAFLISSSLPVNVMAFLIIILVMGNVPLDGTTLLACFILYVCFVAVFYVYKTSIDPAKSVLPTLKRQEEKRRKEIRKIETKIQNKILKIFPEKLQKKIKPKKSQKQRGSKKKI